jgi:hypothetical protein
MPKRKHEGRCRLTGLFGPFVDSHIIPLALTRLSTTGEKLVEAGIGLGVKRRSNSWYDNELVIRAGEDILAVIDDRGIRELRKYKLLWSSWTDTPPDSDVFDDGRPVGRYVAFEQPQILQLFFLSLLWRAAASQRPEFDSITLDKRVFEDLRQRVERQTPGPFQDYPVFLFQMATKGVRHNRAPLLEHRQLPLAAGGTSDVAYVRFYFDGLVAQVNLAIGLELDQAMVAPCSLGLAHSTLVFTHPFEESRVFDNLNTMLRIVDAEQRRPAVQKTEVAVAISAYANLLGKRSR